MTQEPTDQDLQDAAADATEKDAQRLQFVRRRKFGGFGGIVHRVVGHGLRSGRGFAPH